MATAFGTLSYKFEGVRQRETLPRSSTETSRKSHKQISHESLTGDKKRISRKRSHSPSWTTSMDQQETGHTGIPVSHNSNVRMGASSSSNQVTDTVQSPGERATKRQVRSRLSTPGHQADRLITASAALCTAPPEPDVSHVLSSLTGASRACSKVQLPNSQHLILDDALTDAHASKNQGRRRLGHRANVGRAVQSRAKKTIQKSTTAGGQRAVQRALPSFQARRGAKVDLLPEDTRKRKWNEDTPDTMNKRRKGIKSSEFAESSMKEDAICEPTEPTDLLLPQKLTKEIGIIEQRPEASTSKISQEVRYSTTELKILDPRANMPITRCKWSKCSAREQGSVDNLIKHIIVQHIPVDTPSAGYFCEWKGCIRRGVKYEDPYSLGSHVSNHTEYRDFNCFAPKAVSRFMRSDAWSIHHMITHSLQDFQMYDLPTTLPGDQAILELKEGGNSTASNLQKTKSASSKVSRQAKVSEAKKKCVSYTISDDYTGSETKVKMKKLQVLLGGGFSFEKH